jgi:uncharacterized protein (TIGR02145 family)/uncharacterized repeat protein (TIGR02543 family)
MKKTILRTASRLTYFAVMLTAVLVCIGCSDDSAQNKNSEVGDFVNMFVGGGAKYGLYVDISPIGGGSVSRNPDCISCNAGSKVTVTATAAIGYRFAGWTGAVNDTSDSVTVIMNSDLALTANFISTSVNTYILTVNTTPSGGGNVSREPNQILYNAGDVVSVTAEALDGYIFTGWTGAVIDAANTVTVTMNNNMTLTANFQQIQYTLTTDVFPSGGGGVSRNPNQTKYESGTSVTVTATATSGYTFTGWSGASTATSSSVTIAMNEDKTLIANFRYNNNCGKDGMAGSCKTVVIGSQKWMAENLNRETEGSWCYENSSDSCAKYGRLYTWNAAMTACPSGWHLPTRDEWGALARAAGGTDTYGSGGTAGKALKSTSGWNYYGGIIATDEFGFSALPGGLINYGKAFVDAGYSGLWWTATENLSMNNDYFKYAYVRYMQYNDDGVREDDWARDHFVFSVRCLAN